MSSGARRRRNIATSDDAATGLEFELIAMGLKPRHLCLFVSGSPLVLRAEDQCLVSPKSKGETRKRLSDDAAEEKKSSSFDCGFFFSFFSPRAENVKL